MNHFCRPRIVVPGDKKDSKLAFTNVSFFIEHSDIPVFNIFVEDRKKELMLMFEGSQVIFF